MWAIVLNKVIISKTQYIHADNTTESIDQIDGAYSRHWSVLINNNDDG